MPTQEEALFELYRRGKLDPQKGAVVEELARRKGVSLKVASQPRSEFRQQAMEELAGDVGPIEAFLIGAGKGFYNVGRGLGLAEQPEAAETEAMTALSEKRPYTTGAGEIVGEAAPFLPAAVATGGVVGIVPRILASGAVGAVEGGILAKGRNEDATQAAMVGGGIGLGAEILFPVLGKLGRKIVSRIGGKTTGPMLTAAGLPTPELQQALDAVDMNFDDLTEDAIEVIQKQRPKAVPKQVVRQARFTKEGIPATRGEVTQEFGQRATEQRLLESGADVAAEPFRQYKLQQSEAIKGGLRKTFGDDIIQEETGELIESALSGRKKLLRTQKNDLYERAAEDSELLGGIQIFTDNMTDVVPDTATMRRLSKIQGNQIDGLEDLLVEFGVSKNEDAIEKFIMSGGQVQLLSVSNFEDFRQGLNRLQKADVSGATSVAIGPIKEALDQELDEMIRVVGTENLPSEILDALKGARQTVAVLKKEFSPKVLIGQITGVTKDGAAPLLAASKTYNKIVSKSSPVEETRKLFSSLSASGDKGKQAIAALQASTILDLIEAGFGTESRKVSGVKIFNPIAFKRRLKSIGQDKVSAVFRNQPSTIKSLKNIDKIASDLIPEAGTVPKGSASVILDLANTLGLASISSKIPGGAFLMGSFKAISDPVKKGRLVKTALTPEVESAQKLIEMNYPGLATVLGTAVLTTQENINE